MLKVIQSKIGMKKSKNDFNKTDLSKNDQEKLMWIQVMILVLHNTPNSIQNRIKVEIKRTDESYK